MFAKGNPGRPVGVKNKDAFAPLREYAQALFDANPNIKPIELNRAVVEKFRRPLNSPENYVTVMRRRLKESK